MNKSEIAERAAREIQSECVEYSRATKAVVVNISKATKIVERAIVESRGQLRQKVVQLASGNMAVAQMIDAEFGKLELGDGEPSSAPPNVQTPADWIEVRRGFGSIDLFEDLRNGEFVTASGMNDGGFIVWRKVRSGAAQEVSPPSPECPQCHGEGGWADGEPSACPECGGAPKRSSLGDTRELKAALREVLTQLRTATSNWTDDDLNNLIIERAERLLGEPT